MTKSLINSSIKRDKIYKKVMRLNKDDPAYKAYIAYRNTFNQLKRSVKQNYFHTRISRFRNNSRKLWSELKLIIGKANDKSLESKFLINNILIIDKQTISNEFANFFSSIGRKLAQNIPQSNKPHTDYMPRNNPDSIFLFPANPIEVQKIISTLQNKNSRGHDNLSNTIIKKLNAAISEPLSMIFNNSLLNGYYPDKMKLAKVIPVYKNNDKRVLNNYRPISLLPSISKVFEKIVYKRVMHS